MRIILNGADFSIKIPEISIEFTYGKISGGSIISDTSKTRAVSDFIDVRNGTYIVGLFKDFLYSPIDVIYYDENKQKISSNSTYFVYYDTNNVSYIRFSAKRTDNSTFELEDIAGSFIYRLTNVYSPMFIYGTYTSTGVFNMSTSRLVSNAIPINGSKVVVTSSNSNFSIAELDAWDSNDNYLGKITQNTAIGSSVSYMKIIVKNNNNSNILPDALSDSEITITWV